MDTMQRKIELFKKILNESMYTVVLCGSGLMSESGQMVLKSPEKAYEMEEKYGVSPEEIFTTVYYNNRTAEFFEFYREDMLKQQAEVTETSYVLKKLEDAGKVHCIIDSNIFAQNQRGGCRNVISLHGSIYQNQCPHCGKKYTMEEIRDGEKIPRCSECGRVIRPGVLLFGEMMDSQVMSEASRQIERADALILLGTTMESEVYSKYIDYFEGKYLVIIHKERHYMDEKADLVFIDDPKNVLPKLGY